MLGSISPVRRQGHRGAEWNEGRVVGGGRSLPLPKC